MKWGLGALLLLVVTVALQIFVLNPAAEKNHRDITSQQMTVRAVICAQAQSTANAYRFRSLTPSGKIESIRHFLTRMQAQQQTLRLSRGLACDVAPGFPPFRHQLQQALAQIKKILGRYGEALKKPVAGEPGEGFELPGVIVIPGRTASALGDSGLPACTLIRHIHRFC